MRHSHLPFLKTHDAVGILMILLLFLIMLAGSGFLGSGMVNAAEGQFELRAVDETSGEAIVVRIELTRPRLIRPGSRVPSRIDRLRTIKPLTGRTATDTGFGFVIDGVEGLNLGEGPYEFRVSRGPEYRTIAGNFEIEKTSEDDTTFALPRILDMRKDGWTSGDCLVPSSRESLPIRMSSEDLHVAMVTGKRVTSERGIGDGSMASNVEELRTRRERKEQPNLTDPLWIDSNVRSVAGLAFYHPEDAGENNAPTANDATLDALNALVNVAQQRRNNQPSRQPSEAPESDLESDFGYSPRVAIEDPFAWAVPVYLASDQVDGCFVLGDWLRLDRPILQTMTGRPFSTGRGRTPMTLGREAEQIYWRMLDAGFRMAPLAGCGDDPDLHPVGYNRLYVAGPSTGGSAPSNRSDDAAVNNDGAVSAVTTPQQWWDGVWQGRSFFTNGPLLLASLQGERPGHVFRVSSAHPISLTPELSLTVRDPVEYLEVMYNGQVHYSAKLDEYAKSGGRIPPLSVDKSGWALIRVVTLYNGHFRAASTAPWYFEVDGEDRISTGAVQFFQKWLSEYEDHLKSNASAALPKYAPFIRAARAFWESRLALANSR